MPGKKEIDYIGLIGVAFALGLAWLILKYTFAAHGQQPDEFEKVKTQYELVVVRTLLPMFVATAGAIVGHRLIGAFLARKQ